MSTDNLKFTESHEWVRVEGDEVVIGITAYAAEELGDIVFVDLPDEGTEVQAGGEVGSIESVKAVEELTTPVAGSVSGVNEALADTPETVNDDPYGEGWMVKVKVSDTGPLDGLMDADAYEKHTQA